MKWKAFGKHGNIINKISLNNDNHQQEHQQLLVHCKAKAFPNFFHLSLSDVRVLHTAHGKFHHTNQFLVFPDSSYRFTTVTLLHIMSVSYHSITSPSPLRLLNRRKNILLLCSLINITCFQYFHITPRILLTIQL